VQNAVLTGYTIRQKMIGHHREEALGCWVSAGVLGTAVGVLDAGAGVDALAGGKNSGPFNPQPENAATQSAHAKKREK